jgi:UDP-N-acetylglucosamine:LPS N-acetylglucosamine transferase
VKIVLAGAGTAGHIEPALAVANAWQQDFPTSKFEFVGTASGLENVLVTGAGFKLSTIPKVTLPRSLSPSGLLAPLHFGQSLFKSLQIVKGADCVIGFGGYVSALENLEKPKLLAYLSSQRLAQLWIPQKVIGPQRAEQLKPNSESILANLCF